MPAPTLTFKQWCALNPPPHVPRFRGRAYQWLAENGIVKYKGMRPIPSDIRSLARMLKEAYLDGLLEGRRHRR